jgi:gamma-glutamyltranspeptidase / glutathione hydrolase
MSNLRRRYSVQMTKATAAILLCTAAFVAPSSHAQLAPELPSGWVAKRDIETKESMVAAAHPLAVAAGVAALRAGGSAVDAAIATQLALNVVEPQSSGIGGGAFLLVHDGKTNTLNAYDGRETAPAAAKADRFIGGDGKPLPFYEQVVGGKSVGVPGTVKLLAHAHAKHGKLKWESLFEHAISLAENGFAVTPRMHMAIRTDRFLKNDANARGVFFDASGEPLAVGATIKQPALAATLKILARDGEKAFYAGEIPAAIVKAAAAHSNAGDVTTADFAAYKVIERAPICGPYRGFKVCGFPAPSSGGVAVTQMLGMLERFDLAATKRDPSQFTHLISEAGRLAYADRNRYLADPAFVSQPTWLTDADYIRSRSALINENKSMGRGAPGNPPAQKVGAFADDRSYEFNSTSHISVVDAAGNAVSMTTTIEDTMGARLMVGGFLLNNELTDFSALPEENGQPVANRIEPGKRPRSTMSPTIVYDKDGRVHMVTGSPGGSSIINYVVKSIIGVIDWGLSPQAAIDLPNVGSRNGPTELERNTPAEKWVDALKSKGHEPRVLDFTSGLHTIVRTKNGWIGGADPRREGTAAGH